jgi:hypothetical protein
MAKMECNICHEYAVAGKSHRTLLYPDYTRAPWWTRNVLADADLPRWLHWPLELVLLALGGYVTSLVPPLFHISHFLPVGTLPVLLGFLPLLAASELLSRFWQRRLGLRRGRFHRYHCSSCSSHWEWVEVPGLVQQPAQAGTTKPQAPEIASQDES